MIQEIKSELFPLTRADFYVYQAFCKGCGLCMAKCPTGTIIWSENLGVYGTPSVKPKDEDSCIGCGICEMACPDCAIKIERKKPAKKA